MITIKKITNYIRKNHIYFMLGLLTIVFVFWNRIIRERLPRSIYDFCNTYMMYITIFNILSLLLMITTTIYLLWLKNNNNEEKSRIPNFILEQKQIIRIIDTFFDILEKIRRSPKITYRLFYDNINISYVLEKPLYKISHFIKELPIKYAYILTVIHVILYTIPKTIPPIIFVIDVFFFGYLNYFYKSLFLYLIIILYNTLLWVLEDLSDNNIYYATAHIKVNDTINELTATLRDKIPPIEDAIDIISRKNDQALLEWFVYIYETYLDIKWLTYRLNLEKDKLKNYERLFISTLYLCSWSYILYVNIFIPDIINYLEIFEKICYKIEEPFSGIILNNYN